MTTTKHEAGTGTRGCVAEASVAAVAVAVATAGRAAATASAASSVAVGGACDFSGRAAVRTLRVEPSSSVFWPF